MTYFVKAHREHPPRESDGAFRTLPQTQEEACAPAAGATDEELRSALTELESLQLVECVGARRGETRWRATDHGVSAMGRRAA